MQLGALDSKANLIFADDAKKHQDYQCIECKQVVRLRRGNERKAHYYHLEPNRTCKQHSKGMPHLMLQQFLKNLLPEGEAELEWRFSSIGRIADVVWHPQRLVYEIQCSAISKEEVQNRNLNYASIGYQVVWIFHDERYNQRRLSAAEEFISHHPHYFSNMNEKGEGTIYDQFALVLNGKRIQRLQKLPIDPSTPKKFLISDSSMKQQLPYVLKKRRQSWPIIFSGDTLDWILNKPEKSDDDQEKLKELMIQLKDWFAEENNPSFFYSLKKVVRKGFSQTYLALLRLILERACR